MKKQQPMGRPRNVAVDEAIRQVTLELLRERGYGRLHLSDVIRRSGVSSASVYRRWRSKWPLVLDLGREALAPVPTAATATAREELLSLLAAWSRPQASTFLCSALPALVAEAAHDPELAAGLGTLLAGPREQVRSILEGDGERLQGDVDAGLVLDVLLGGLVSAEAGAGIRPREIYHGALVDLVLDGVRGQEGRSRPETEPERSGPAVHRPDTTAPRALC